MKKLYNGGCVSVLNFLSRHQLCRNIKVVFIAVLAPVMFITACKKDIIKSGSGATDAEKTSPRSAIAPSISDASLAMTVYHDRFYDQYGTYGSSYKARYWKDESRTSSMDFWTQQEAIETLIDAYEVSQQNNNANADWKNKIAYLFNGVIDRDGTSWLNNKYNDDLIWGAIMSIRAWKIHNDSRMLDVAKGNFNNVWYRGWDTNSLGGGIWWTTDNQTKNTCVNAPAAICAMLLYKATGDAGYRDKAKLIMDWMINKLYVPSTGEVKGAIVPPNNITEGASTYNQGTFIGACEALRYDYPDAGYLAIGLKAMEYARKGLCNPSTNILVDENYLADTQGFKSIFARWAGKFVQATNTRNIYGNWLDSNAKKAWEIRNSRGLMWTVWGTRTDEGQRNSFETTCGVSMMNNVQRYQSSQQGIYLANGTYKIVNRANGKALDAKANGTANGTEIDTWPYNGGNNQKWTLTDAGNGFYKIIGVGSGRSINIYGATKNNGDPCVLWDYEATANELVYLVPQPGGYYSIVFSHSNRALDLNTSSGKLTQWDINGGNNQQWQFQAP